MEHNLILHVLYYDYTVSSWLCVYFAMFTMYVIAFVIMCLKGYYMSSAGDFYLYKCIINRAIIYVIAIQMTFYICYSYIKCVISCTHVFVCLKVINLVRYSKVV